MAKNTPKKKKTPTAVPKKAASFAAAKSPADVSNAMLDNAENMLAGRDPAAGAVEVTTPIIDYSEAGSVPEIDAVREQSLTAESVNTELETEIETLKEIVVNREETVKQFQDKSKADRTHIETQAAEIVQLTEGNDKLETELASAKSEKLPQVIRLDVLYAAHVRPNLLPRAIAGLACEAHAALMAECRERAANKAAREKANG